MKKIFIFPTIEQAKGFILSKPHDPVFVAGIGMAEIAAAVVRAVKAKKPQLVILCGLAESYDLLALPIGEVAEVITERIAGIPGLYQTTAPDTGLPTAAGVTCTGPRPDSAAGEEIGVLRCTPNPEEHLQTGKPENAGDELPLLSNTEGAAFFAVCEALGVAGCEIRAVTARAGDRPRAEDVQQAIDNLTEVVTEIFSNDE